MSSDEGPIKFSVRGLMISYQFQQCQYLVNMLHRHFPEKYLEPEIRPMLNVDWEVHLLKIRRRFGGKDLWKLKVPVAVFRNGAFFGDNEALVSYVTELYTINLNVNFADMGVKQLMEHFENMSSIGRHFVYLLIMIDDTIIGTIVIMLYSDLVPETCKFFLNRCKRDVLSSSTVSAIRIVPNSWLQFKAMEPSEAYSMPCENYAVPHDRRGVVSLCQINRKRVCCLGCIITLDPTLWMNGHCVAFGQVIQGEETLQILERAPTENEVPLQRIQVAYSNSLIISKQPRMDTYIRLKTGSVTSMNQEEVDTISVADSDRLRKGFYCLPTDLRSYSPFLHLPDYLLAYLKNNVPVGEETQERSAQVPQGETKDIQGEELETEDSEISLKQSLSKSKGFLVHSREDLMESMTTLQTLRDLENEKIEKDE